MLLQHLIKLDVRVHMIKSKAEVAIEAVASASALVTDTTVGARGLFPVLAIRWDRVFSCHRALEVSLVGIGVGNFEKRLGASCRTLGSWDELQQLLFASVVSVGEEDGNFRLLLVGFLVNINLNLGDCEVGERLQSILNRVGVLISSHAGRINLDWTSVVLTAELVNETEGEESFRRTAFVFTGQLLEVVATVCVTVGLRVVAFGALAERAVVTFVASVAVALLVFEPRPVNTPRGGTCGAGIFRNLSSESNFGGLTEVVERVRIGTALSVSTAVVRARGAAATFTSEGREAFAFTSGAVAQTTSTTLAVCVLVVKRSVFGALRLFAN